MAKIKDVKLTFSNKSPRLPIKIEIDGENWTNISEIGWKAKWEDACSIITLSFRANLEVEYVD